MGNSRRYSGDQIHIDFRSVWCLSQRPLFHLPKPRNATVRRFHETSRSWSDEQSLSKIVFVVVIVTVAFYWLLVTTCTKADNYTSNILNTNATLPTYNVQLNDTKRSIKMNIVFKKLPRHESNYIIKVRRSKHWSEHTNNRFSFPSVACFLRFLYSAIFSSYLESSAVYSLLLWASTVYKHTARRFPFLLREFNDEVININIFVFMYM